MDVQKDPGATAAQSARIYAEDTLGLEDAAGLDIVVLGEDADPEGNVFIQYTGGESLIEKLLIASAIDADDPENMWQAR